MNKAYGSSLCLGSDPSIELMAKRSINEPTFTIVYVGRGASPNVGAFA